jgi:Tfp pilus assembly protein PilO
MNRVLQQILATTRRAPFAIFCVVLLVLLGVANYFLWDQRRTVTDRHEEVRHDGEAMLLALTDHARINSQLATVQEALDLIDHNLLVEGDLAFNLGYFYQMETLSRVRVTQLNQLSSQPSTDENPFRAIPFSLRVTGSYAQLMNFLRNLETGPRLLRVKTYAFSRGDPKTNALMLELTVELLGSK